MISRVQSALTGAKVLGGAGIVKPYSPLVLGRAGKALLDWGTGPAGGFTTLALMRGDQVGLIDELGELTFAEIHQRSNAVARGLAALGVTEGDSVAVMCRNHRGFIEATVGIAKLGADILYLNTAFAGPQLSEVLEREGPRVVIHDEEFTDLLGASSDAARVIAWTDTESTIPTMETLIRDHDAGDLDPPDAHSRIVILTSGTTGTPKGAPRNEAGIPAAVSLLSRMPLHEGWRTHIAAPLFHTWGFAHMALAMLLGSTLVLHRKFDPRTCLEIVDTHRCQSLVVIPVMLQRIMQLSDEVLGNYSLGELQAVAASGSALPGDLAVAWMDQFGDNLYNIYGSTEVAYASVATPRDLREAPSSAGKPPHATVVRIFDDNGHEVPDGRSGRIFVGNGLLFEGYTGGGHKEVIDGLMSSGDVGRFGTDGRLYVEGRDDEMIVSGGENVFPKEVEDCLARHDDVVEVACVGVDDDSFGKRLRAFVVLAESARATESDLQDWVKQNLARFKVPREIRLTEELPRNSTGKIVKRELDQS